MSRICLIVLLCYVFPLDAQDAKYWILLKDKDEQNYNYQEHLSPQAIENRKRLNIPLHQYSDIPISHDYLQKLTSEGIQPIVKSKWLNAISADLTADQIKWLKQQSFVKRIVLIDRRFKVLEFNPWENLSYATAISQMEPDAFQKLKLNGKGVTIGVIDAGFYDSHRRRSLSEVLAENRVLGVRDFVNPKNKELFRKPETASDSHGTRVMEMIAGRRLSNSKQYGLATHASFYLARTDDGNNEFRGEEDYWIAAMEWMDSLGVRIINTSLGYSLGFDNPDENYKPDEMDGKTALISQAAQIAVDEKGILLIVSAGNEGLDPDWKVVSAPADAKGVMSVGATNRSGSKAPYSSIGPLNLGYLKPNISCYSADGTSFSAPVITGFAACLMQKDPYATNKKIAQIIEQSASLYPYGNNYIGYGIPKAAKAINLINGKTIESSITEKLAKGKDQVILKTKNNKEHGHALVFHKSNDTQVVREQYVRISKGKIKLKRPKRTNKSTVVISDMEGFEVTWN
ncbi:MAG: S8 family serine peptidase [Flammeovirgaceae bacterium]